MPKPKEKIEIEDLVEYNGQWHKKGKDGNCEPFTMADLKELINQEKQIESQATHEEICDQALIHYEKISKETCDWNSVVPKAIKFYRDKDKLAREKQNLVEEIRKEEIKKHWSSHLEFLYRYKHLTEMAEEIKNSENWFKNIFGKKDLKEIKQKLNSKEKVGRENK